MTIKVVRNPQGLICRCRGDRAMLRDYCVRQAEIGSLYCSECIEAGHVEDDRE